jgi:hypothetical protein
MSQSVVSFGPEEVEMGTALRERLVSKDAQFVKIWELPSQKLQSTKKWTLDLVADEAIVMNDPFVAVDKHNSLALAYLPHHLQPTTIQETENALKELQIQHPPPHCQATVINDRRHYEMDRLHALYPNERIGKYHFA